MHTITKKEEQFYQILKEERIYPVFQPIVSLKNGEVWGYEALTRFNIHNCLLNTEEFFFLAEELNCLWKVEEMCRRKALLAVKKSGTEIIVLDKNNMVEGILTREHIMNAFGRMCGCCLTTCKTTSELMITNSLVVDKN